MTATIHPFRKSSGGGPRARAGRVECELHPAVTNPNDALPLEYKLQNRHPLRQVDVNDFINNAPVLQQVEALRDARRKLAECWELRAESRRIQRDYEERKLKIEDLMRRYDVERA